MSDERPDNPEIELIILDALDPDVFKSLKQISFETGLEESLIKNTIHYLSGELAIVRKGSLYRWENDSDIADEEDIGDD